MRPAIAEMADSGGAAMVLPLSANMSHPVLGGRTTPAGVGACFGRVWRVVGILLDGACGARGEPGVPVDEAPLAYTAAADLGRLFEQCGSGLELAISSAPGWGIILVISLFGFK